MFKTRAQKLIELQKYMNLETGTINEDVFEWENDLSEKGLKKKVLDEKILKCSMCEGLNIKRLSECCCGWGDLNADIFFVGQSLHKAGMQTGIPFIGGSGYMLDAALRLSGLLRKDVFISNVVKCHPPGNRQSTEEEKRNCLPFLSQELLIVKPELVVALGNDAKAAIEDLSLWANEPVAKKTLCMTHPAKFMYSEPEARVNWIVKLSLQMDKVLKGSKEK